MKIRRFVQNNKANFDYANGLIGCGAIGKIIRTRSTKEGMRFQIEVLSCGGSLILWKVDGFNKKIVRFTTDIPHLPNRSKPLLLGPGSVLVAHKCQ